MISEKKIIAELSEKLARSGLYMSRGEEIKDLVKKLNLDIKEITEEEMGAVRKILSRGEPLSKIVIKTRGSG